MEWFKNKENYYDKEVIDGYPYIIAHEYKRLLDLLDMNQIYGVCLQIRDVYEVLLKFPILIILADINRKKEKLDYENELILEMLLKPLSMGDWVEKADQIIKNKLCVDTELLSILINITNVINSNQIVKWRNDHIGHGALALDDDENFKNDIHNHLVIINDYVTKLKSMYSNIKLVINSKENGYRLLIGYKKIKNIELVNDNDICIKSSENEYSVYPFIEIIKNQVYFFDSYISKKEKTVLLNYIDGNKINVRNNEFINIYNISSNTVRLNKLISSFDDNIYLESELDILNQIEKLNSFESPQYINGWIQSIFEDQSKKKGLILLQAERGMGKSVFVSALDQLSVNKKKIFDRYKICVRAYYINDTYGSSIGNFEREVNEIFTYDIGKCNKVKGTKIFEVNSKQDVARLLNYYKFIQERYYNKDRVLFIIDGIDENIMYNEKFIVDLIPDESMLDEGIFILLTCRINEEIKDNRVLINKLAKMKFIENKSFYRFNNDEYEEILKNYIKKQIRNRKDINNNELNKILKYSDNRFLYLRTICQIIDSKNNSIDLGEIVRDDFIESFLGILKAQYGGKFFDKVLNIFIIIAIFYDKIGIKEISYILGESNPSFEILPILYDLKGFLVVERDKCGNVYSVSNEEIKDVIVEKFGIQINLLINNYFNDILDTNFNYKFDEKSIEVIFLKNITYYMRIAKIDEEKYINISFIEKVLQLIRNFELDSNNYKAIEIFIELCSEIISLVTKLEDKFNRLNKEENTEETWVINNEVLIDIYLFRAMAYSYLNKQILALEDFILVENILTSSTEIDDQQERQLAICYSEMGKIYRYIDINKSIDSYDKAINSYYELSKSNKEYKDDYLGNILNKANTYLRIKPSEALKLYDLFINEYKTYTDNNEKFEKLSFAYVSEARAYKRLNNCEKALKNIELAFYYYDKIDGKSKDKYFLVKLYVNRGSIYLKFYDKNYSYMNKVIEDSNYLINILNGLIEDKIIENNILINTYFNKALALLYKNELDESFKVFISVEKLVSESLDKDEYVNYDMIMLTYKYLIELDKDGISMYYSKLIQMLDVVKVMDNESANMILEELYYILFELIEKKEFKVITQLSYITKNFILCNIDMSESNKISEDIVAIYTLISIAYYKENDQANFEHFSNLAIRDNLPLFTCLFNEYCLNS